MGVVKDGPSSSNHYYNNGMSKYASLNELSTPLTTSGITKAEKKTVLTAIYGVSVEADACISGRHMLPLMRLLMEPRLVVEARVSYSVHGFFLPISKPFDVLFTAVT